jgi:hypothetical protein
VKRWTIQNIAIILRKYCSRCTCGNGLRWLLPVVVGMLEIVEEEIVVTMGFVGVNRLDELNPDYVAEAEYCGMTASAGRFSGDDGAAIRHALMVVRCARRRRD